MKKYILFLLLFIPALAIAQNRTMDTITFKRGGSVYRMILYGDDSLKINTTVFHTVQYPTITDLFGLAMDSTAIDSSNNRIVGYATGNGFEIDTIVFIPGTFSGSAIDVTVQVYYGDSLGDGTGVFSSPVNITDSNEAIKQSTFSNSTISGGNIIWFTFTAVTTRPRNFMMQIIGHRL